MSTALEALHLQYEVNGARHDVKQSEDNWCFMQQCEAIIREDARVSADDPLLQCVQEMARTCLDDYKDARWRLEILELKWELLHVGLGETEVAREESADSAAAFPRVPVPSSTVFWA